MKLTHSLTTQIQHNNNEMRKIVNETRLDDYFICRTLLFTTRLVVPLSQLLFSVVVVVDISFIVAMILFMKNTVRHFVGQLSFELSVSLFSL